MKTKITNKLGDFLFFLSILFFTVGLNFQDTPPPNGWYQQFTNLPGGTNIVDMLFLDSLTGFIVTNPPKIFKTTNGGDNWQLNYEIGRFLYEIQFVNDSIGFVAGARVLVKTTNRGVSWDTISAPEGTANGLYALNEDTIWIVGSSALVGGIFRTTNGGANWTRITPPTPYPGGVSPLEIYMLDFNTGFYSGNTYTYKTTNGGANWYNVSAAFNDIYFINYNTGWHCEDVSDIYKTTNAGENWEILPLPPANDSIITSKLNDFAVLNEDTIWGVGPIFFFGAGQFRGLIYITTDGGNTWGYQLPDTSIHIPDYKYIQLTDKNHGWAYRQNRGVHTVTGGDTTIMLDVEQISNEIPKSFVLHQNYPNPFNPVTTIIYELKIKGDVKLAVYDVTGKLIQELVNQVQNPGFYNYSFDGTGLPSGVYFYRIRVHSKGLGTEDFINAKKILLVK